MPNNHNPVKELTFKAIPLVLVCLAGCTGLGLPPSAAVREYPEVVSRVVDRPFAEAVASYAKGAEYCHAGRGIATFSGTVLVGQAWLHDETRDSRVYVIGTKGAVVATVIRLQDEGGQTRFRLQSTAPATYYLAEAQRTANWLDGRLLEDCADAHRPAK